MNALNTQAIATFAKENFEMYTEDYPISLVESENSVSSTDDANASIAGLIKAAYELDESQEQIKGSIEEYTEVIIDTFVNHFEIADGNYDEHGENRTWIEDEIKRLLND